MDIVKYRENKKIRILIIEDEEILSKIYSDIFSREGYKVLTSKNGKSAINKYSENTVDLIFIDLMLPDLSGLDILEYIRSKDKNIKVIILTNISNENIRNEVEKLGISKFLVKSEYTPNQLLSILEEVISTV